MVSRWSECFILFCVALLATVSGFSGHALGEQLGDRTDPLEIEVISGASPEAPKFEMEMVTEVTTVGAPGSYSIKNFDDAGLMSTAQDIAWDQPLVVNAPARRPTVSESKPRRFDVTPTAGAIAPMDADATIDSSAAKPIPTYSAGPDEILEELGEENDADSSVFNVNPEPSGKTLLAALLGSLVLIGGFTHVLRPRREEVQPIRF